LLAGRNARPGAAVVAAAALAHFDENQYPAIAADEGVTVSRYTVDSK